MNESPVAIKPIFILPNPIKFPFFKLLSKELKIQSFKKKSDVNFAFFSGGKTNFSKNGRESISC